MCVGLCPAVSAELAAVLCTSCMCVCGSGALSHLYMYQSGVRQSWPCLGLAQSQPCSCPPSTADIECWCDQCEECTHTGLHCTPEWAAVHTHQQCTLHEGVWCRTGGVPPTAHCSLHCTTEWSVGPQVDGKGGHSVVCRWDSGVEVCVCVCVHMCVCVRVCVCVCV